MAKDPAFLFYPGDWLGGTMSMSYENKGIYISILMLQFNCGHMSYDMIGQYIGQQFGQFWDKHSDKFIIDDSGLYYNAKLEEEKNKRKSFTDSRYNNKSGKNQFTDIVGHKTTNKTKHMEDGNINSISIPINTLIGEQKIKNQEQMIVIEMMKVWKKHNPKYPEDANEDYPACLEIAYKIATVKGWKKADVIDFMELKCLDSWDKIVAFIKTDPFLKNLALKNLSNQFQMIFQKMQNKNEEMSLNGHSAKVVKKSRAQIEKEMEEWANS